MAGGAAVSRRETAPRFVAAYGGSPTAVLLLDEPTANLDPASVERVECYLLALAREHGAGMIWVSHDAAQFARVATRAMRIERGRLEVA